MKTTTKFYLTTVVFLSFFIKAYSQITFPQPDNGIETRFGAFVDAFGEPPNGGNGRQKGLFFTAIMDYGYIEISTSNFSQLENGYNDIVFSGGLNFHLFNYENIRYFTGLRLSPCVYRGRDRHELIGGVIGFDYLITNRNKDFKIYLGAMIFVDHSEDLEDGKGYRHSKYYDGGVIFKSSTVRENGAFRVSIQL